jgi:2-dehydro-3-deoxy-D-arabinonate dehydratase
MMKLYTKDKTIWLEFNDKYFLVEMDWDVLVNRIGLYNFLLELIPTLAEVSPIDLNTSFNPPIGTQELWAAGVTYLRSKVAREKESENEGGASFYDKVYVADRPELFFKALAYRIAGHQDYVHIRKDSTWDVPEPELTLFISSEGTIEGYTIGNDMSSRSIEGQNPLYLAQAKVYDRSASLGPCLTVLSLPISSDTSIKLSIYRNEVKIFEDTTSVSQIKRTFDDLVKYLFLETTFEKGVMLMTGTGIIPPDDFTLQINDRVEISIDHVGTLINTVKTKE